MARAQHRSNEDRTALRQARLMGAALSSDELDDLDDGSGNDRSDAIQGKDGKVDMCALLRELLKTLGINVPGGDTDADFKRALVTAAMEKIRELTGNGQGGANNNQQDGGAWGNGNPLIPGSQPNGGQQVEPIYMALSLAAADTKSQARRAAAPDLNEVLAGIANMADPVAQKIALSLLNDQDTLRRRREEAEAARLRNAEASMIETRGKLQPRINALLSNAPADMRADFDAALGQCGVALSADGADPREAVVARFERELAVRNPHLAELKR